MSLMKSKDREPNSEPEFMDPDPGSGKQYMNPADLWYYLLAQLQGKMLASAPLK
jgi:hypothetical protein